MAPSHTARPFAATPRPATASMRYRLRTFPFLKAYNLREPGLHEQEMVWDVPQEWCNDGTSIFEAGGSLIAARGVPSLPFCLRGRRRMRARGSLYGNGVAHLLVHYNIEKVYSRDRMRKLARHPFHIGSFIFICIEERNQTVSR